jgi:hypothetical protein
MNQNMKEHPTGFMKWKQKLGKTICIKDMLKFTFHHLKENKLKIFRWKLLHFILPCKQLLYQWKIESTPLCDTCHIIDDYEHYFCPPPPQSGVGDMEMPGIRPLVRLRYVVSALRFLFVDQLISNLHTSIILGISSLSSKLDKIRTKIVRMVAIFKMSAETHQNFQSATISTKIDI